MRVALHTLDMINKTPLVNTMVKEFKRRYYILRYIIVCYHYYYVLHCSDLSNNN